MFFDWVRFLKGIDGVACVTSTDASRVDLPGDGWGPGVVSMLFLVVSAVLSSFSFAFKNKYIPLVTIHDSA